MLLEGQSRQAPHSDGDAVGALAPSTYFVLPLKGCGRVPGFVLVLEGWNVLVRKEPVGPGSEWSLSVAVGEPEQCFSDPGGQLL